MKRISLALALLIIFASYPQSSVLAQSGECDPASLIRQLRTLVSAGNKTTDMETLQFIRGEINQQETACASTGDDISHAGKWTVKIQTSQLTDAQKVVMTLDADTEVKAKHGTETPTLVLRCSPGQFEMFIAVGVTLEGAKDDTSTVQIRLDKDAVQDVQMTRSTSNDALFFVDANHWLTQMLDHSSLAVGFVPQDSIQVETSFDLRDLKWALGKAYDICAPKDKK